MSVIWLELIQDDLGKTLFFQLDGVRMPALSTSLSSRASLMPSCACRAWLADLRVQACLVHLSRDFGDDDLLALRAADHLFDLGARARSCAAAAGLVYA